MPTASSGDGRSRPAVPSPGAATPRCGPPFSLAHAGFGGLLGDGLVGEYPDPDLPATLHESRHRHAGGLDLAGGDPTRRGSLPPALPVGGFRLGEPVLDVRPQGMEGNPTFPVPLGAGHFGSAQPSGHVDLDPLGAELHRGENGLFHRSPEGDPPLELHGDVFGGQLGIGLRAPDLLDRDRALLLDELLEVLLQVLGLVLLGVPPRSPILDDPQPKPVRMYLLSQKPPPFGSSLSRYFSSTTMVI